jgi:hypothetical protein
MEYPAASDPNPNPAFSSTHNLDIHIQRPVI